MNFPPIKARYLDQYLHSRTIQGDWIKQSLHSFNSWNHTTLTEPYLTRALNGLPDIKQHRKIIFLGVWIGAFIEGQNSAERRLLCKRGSQVRRLIMISAEVSDSLDS